MDNIIFMSEIVEAASNVDNKVIYLNTITNSALENVSNIINNSNTITNQIKQLPDYIFPDITIKGFTVAPNLPNGTYYSNVNGTVLLYDAWIESERTEGSKDSPDFNAKQSTTKVYQGESWTAKSIKIKSLFHRDSYRYAVPDPGSYTDYYTYHEAWSTPITIKKGYAYVFDNPICFIEASIPTLNVIQEKEV